MQLKMFGATDQGLVRTSNQDSLFFSADYGIVIVSDGMGGHRGGEIASSLAVNGLRDAYLASNQILVENVGSFLDDVLRNINADILQRGNEDERLSGMGATINYLQFAGGTVAIGHAGDSRTYLSRVYYGPGGIIYCGLWQITFDHNVGNFVERGLIKLGSQAKPLTSRQKSRLTRGMGVMKDLKADLYTKNLMDGDVFLTCSDGLHGFVAVEDIITALCAGPIGEAPDRLIAKAKEVGAPDNVTVVISVWAEAEEPLRAPPSPSYHEHLFLVRMPEGEILGPMDVDKVIKKWQMGELTFDTEVCSRLNRWVFLHNTKLLFEVYPEFDKQVVKDFLARVQPESIMSMPGSLRERIGKGYKTSNSKYRILLILAWIIIFLIAVGLLFLTYAERAQL